MTAKLETAARRLANKWLSVLPTYHDGLPISDIDQLLLAAGLNPTEPSIYCGREGRATHQVGDRSWLCLSWYKMDVTGRYEVVAYVS